MLGTLPTPSPRSSQRILPEQRSSCFHEAAGQSIRSEPSAGAAEGNAAEDHGAGGPQGLAVQYSFPDIDSARTVGRWAVGVSQVLSSSKDLSDPLTREICVPYC